MQGSHKSKCSSLCLYCFSSGSIDGNNQLIIKGRFQQKQIENVLRRYISKLMHFGGCA